MAPTIRSAKLGYDENGATSAIRPTPAFARAIARSFGTNPSSSAASSTSVRVLALTRAGWLMASDTVEMLTPARAATS